MTIENEIRIAFVRRVSQHCMRFMTGYREGLIGPLLEYAVKKYTSHRAIPASSVSEITKDFNDRNILLPF